MKTTILIVLIILFIGVSPTYAQDGMVTMPDLTGLNIAQAAARLNEVGLQLGQEQVELWSITSPQEPNTISGQSVAPDTQIAYGSTIDITVLRAPNMRLLYDDNDLTLINESGNIIDITGLRFASSEGTSASLAVAARMNSYIRENQCYQMWTLWRNGPKGVEDCQFIQSWLREMPANEHFWTQTNGVQNFVVLENGTERVSCPAAPANSQDNPLECEFFFGGIGAEDITPYIYFAYTPTSIALINQSTDKWMPTDRTEIFRLTDDQEEDSPRNSLYMGDPALFGDPDIIGDITLLAPGQCLLFTVNQPQNIAPPQPCNVIAYADINPEFAFWTTLFQIESATDGRIHDCPAADPERPVICILPQ